MAKKKLYIFFTYGYYGISGGLMYTAGKADYLQKRGWKVLIFSHEPVEGKVLIPSLNQYRWCGGMFFFLTPPYKLKKYEQDYCLDILLQRLEGIPLEEYDIIIETPHDRYAYWAELFAAKIGARHFIVCCHEDYRPTEDPTIAYGDNLDFFYFKWKRNELVIGDNEIKKLFNGYKNITAPLIEMPETIREQDAIQDVDFPIEKVENLDWNICHIGRAGKDYVPFVIEGVGELARRHPDKNIQLIMVGNADSRMNLISKTFEDLPNVFILLLGDLVPIPRVLFSKVDVVCAISKSARFAVDENVLTIVGTVDNYERTPGVLGYDTEEEVYGEATFSYVDALENVLVKRLYDNQKCTLPKLRPAEEYYDSFWTIVKNASPVKEYYTQRLLQPRIRNWTAIFPFGSIARGARIILCGETEITKDYRRQIASQQNSSTEFGRDYIKTLKPDPYCQIVATVDENADEFDDEVTDLSRLKDRDYDAIVICLPPQQVQSIYNKILQIVPDMANRILYNMKTLSV